MKYVCPECESIWSWKERELPKAGTVYICNECEIIFQIHEPEEIEQYIDGDVDDVREWMRRA